MERVSRDHLRLVLSIALKLYRRSEKKAFGIESETVLNKMVEDILTRVDFTAPLRGRTLEEARLHNPNVPDLENRWLTSDRKRKALSQQATRVFSRSEPPLSRRSTPMAIEADWMTMEENMKNEEEETEVAELFRDFAAAGRAFRDGNKRIDFKRPRLV